MGKMNKIRKLKSATGDKLFAMIVSLPVVIMTTLFILVPVADSVYKSFLDFRTKNIIKGIPGEWNNFENYIDLFTDDKLWSAILVTFTFVIFVVLFQIIIGFTLALILDSNLRGSRFIRSIMMLPWVVPTIISALLWMWLYQAEYGLFKYFVELITFGRVKDFAMLNSMDTALFGVSNAALWKQIPLSSLLLLAGLANVPTETLEAASLDGANYMQKLFHVIIPSMKSVISITISMAIIQNFKQFPLFWTMTGGGPNGATTNLAILSYREAFVSRNLGSGAAVTTIWMLIMIIVVFINRKVFSVKE